MNLILQRMFDAGRYVAEFFGWLGDLSADVFWATVTSYAAISLLGVVVAISFTVSHVPALAQRFFPQLMVYAQAAGKVCLVASFAMAFALGYRTSSGRAEIEQLKNDLDWSESQLEQQRRLADAAEQLRKDALKAKSDAEGELRDYKQKFGENPLAPPPGVLDELRQLQRHPAERRAGAKPRSAIGSALARVRALGGNRQ